MASQETSEERRTYKRNWMRRQRAEVRKERGPIGPSDRWPLFLRTRMETELAAVKQREA